MGTIEYYAKKRDLITTRTRFRLVLLGCLLIGLSLLLVRVVQGANITWDPSTGYYTHWWMDWSNDFIDVLGLFWSLTLPFTAQIGHWFYFILWGVFVAGLYLWTQDITMPFVVGVLSGAMMASLMGEEALLAMTLVMVFSGAGVLTKVLLGRT